MNNHTLQLHTANWSEDFKQFKDTKRSFTTVEILDFTGFDNVEVADESLSALRSHGSNVTELLFFTSSMVDNQTLSKFLQCFPQLKKLVLISTTFRTSENSFEINRLPALEEVVMIDSDIELLYFLMAAQLLTLKIKGITSYEGHDKPLFSFLRRQIRLKSLALRSVNSDYISTFIHKVPKTFPHQLQRLSLLEFNIDFNEDQIDENFLQFLDRFSGSLEMLEIGNQFDNLVYQLILSKFNHLHEIHLHTENMTDFKMFSLFPSALDKVTSLIIDGRLKFKMSDFSDLFEAFPNVENLKLINSCFDGDLIVWFIENLKRLKHLSVPKMNIDEKSHHQRNKGSLLTLHCDEFSKTFNWHKFTKINPKIEKISIKFLDENQLTLKDFSSILKNLKDLKHLNLGFGFKLTNENFAAMTSQGKSLTTLNYLSHDGDVYDIFDGIDLKLTKISFNAYHSIYKQFKEENVDAMWTREAEKYYEVVHTMAVEDSSEEDDSDSNPEDKIDD